KIKDTYTVNITKSNGCKGSGSIDATIALGGCTVLSTSILDFTLQKQGTGVLLQWISPVTVDNDHYDIERSAEGNTWQGIGAVKAQQGSGNITYKFTDALPIHGTNYYRLKQVDINGRSSYSQVRKVEFTGLWAIKQYPNPASDYLILEFNNDKEEKAFITIQTASGSTVFAKEQTLAKGFNRLKLNQVQPLAQGTYFITLSTASNLYHAKFVKGEK
ncbi:MAG TPA: T9SS type A sorting domain-containing protein, partial [Chitinophagaceae bacterium]|nr:T9SS type A sorting domain-containing protein [Chitinophagaceae bacterium]